MTRGATTMVTTTTTETTTPERSATTMSEVERELELRRAAGLKIDPATAEVMWARVQILDPYGIRDDFRPEEYCVGAVLFARTPGGVWVSQYELPDATLDALWIRIEQGPAEADGAAFLLG
jgi:hypothetical protein